MILSRLGVPGRLQGRLQADVHGDWHGEASGRVVQVDGSAAVAGLDYADPRMLGGDQLHADSVAVQARFSVSNQLLHVGRLVLHSELGHLDVSGSTHVAHLAGADWRRLVRPPFGPEGQRVAGRLDLAQLARTLPRTLRVRGGTELTSGQMEFEFTGSDPGGNAIWQGSVQTSTLTGLHGGRTVQWDQPLQLALQCAQSPGGLLLEQVSCQAGFLELSGHGRSDEGEVTVEGDLTKLASELGKFFDMRQLQLEGRVSAEASWHFPEGQSADASARLSLNDFQLVTGADRVWREKQLTVTLSATGSACRDRTPGQTSNRHRCSCRLLTIDWTRRLPEPFRGKTHRATGR